jgi:hypothetical protein
LKVYDLNVLLGIFTVDTKRVLDLSLGFDNINGSPAILNKGILLQSSSSLSRSLPNLLNNSNLNIFMRPRSMDALNNFERLGSPEKDDDSGDRLLALEAQPCQVSGSESIDNHKFMLMLGSERVSLLTFFGIILWIAFIQHI